MIHADRTSVQTALRTPVCRLAIATTAVDFDEDSFRREAA